MAHEQLRNGTTVITREPLRPDQVPYANKRRHSRFPAATLSDASGGDYSADQLEFLRAMDRYKTDNRRPWPTCAEVLEVLRSLGYRKVEAPAALPAFRAGSSPDA